MADSSRKSGCVMKRTCSNPWNRACGNSDIVVYIRYQGEQRSICRSCWRDIAKKGVEW
jgi:hypothetical protein